MSDTPPPAPAPAPAPAPDAPWHAAAQFDAETLGHVQNRGWDKLDAPAAAAAAIKAHKEAERLIGVPADQIIRLPKDPNDAVAWKQVNARLGVPADAKGYDFTSVKHADGTALTQPEIDRYSAAALSSSVPKQHATTLVASLVKADEASSAAEFAEKSAKLNEQKTALAKNWGQNAAANLHVAKTAAERLGVTPAEVTALEGVIGYDRIMEMFRQVGANIAEDKWIDATKGPGGTAVMTKEQAVAKKAELLADDDWTTKWQGGDVAKNREMLNLNSIITGASE